MNRHKILSGLRVIDMSRVLAGPYATMLLGDLGAEVLKIEDPINGDVTRSWGPPFLNNQSAYYLSINRNKKSLAINLKTYEGVQIIKDLVQSSDVVIENFLPGKLDKIGLSYESLKEVNKKLIYCSISGYGFDGPYQDRGGYDVIASSIGGLNYITGPEDGQPCRVGIAMTDISTGLFAKSSILAALLNREKTGCGMKIDCDLLSTQISVLSHIASNFLNCGEASERWGTGHPSIVPYQSFLTKDGKYLTVGAGTNQHFKVLSEKLNLDILEDEKFRNNSDRVKNRKELISLLTDKFIQKDCYEWLKIFQDCSFPYGPINDIPQVFSDPQVLHNNLISHLTHEKYSNDIKVAGHPVAYDKQRGNNQGLDIAPPILGEHTFQVLKDVLNFTDSKLKAFSEKNIIKDGKK